MNVEEVNIKEMLFEVTYGHYGALQPSISLG